MKFFLAHRVSGEDYDSLKVEMEKVVSALKGKEMEPYCSFLERESYSDQSKKDLIQNAFSKIDESDGTFVIIKTPELSEGMLIEFGYTVGKGKKLILAIKEGVMEGKYVRALADETIEFSDIDDLVEKIGGLNVE